MIVKKLIWLRKPSALCGWLLLFMGMSYSQTKISSVEIIGNTFFTARTLLDQLPSQPGTLLSSLDQSSAFLTERYHSEGFYSFSIDSVTVEFSDDSLSASVQIFLHEQVRTVISSVSFSGNTAVSSQTLMALIESSEGSSFRQSLAESDIQSILNYYSRNGYPFASISSDSIQIDPNDETKLIVHFKIDESAPVSLHEIRTEGNSVTSTDVVVREARLVKGELFDHDKLEKIRRRLERSQLFSSISDPQLYIASGSKSDTLVGGLLITVKEGNTNTFDGIVGYVPSGSPNVDGYFTGNVFVAMRNLFGTGRKALVRWQRETATTQELELQYKEPWIFGIPLSIGGTLFQRKQDSSYVKTKVDLRGEFVISEELSVAGTVSSETVYPSSTVQQFTVFESNAIFFGGELLYDTRDDLRNPTDGLRYAATVQQGTKNITGPKQFLSLTTQKTFSVQKYSLDAETFISTFHRHVIMIGIHGKQISSSQLDVSDLFQFGGTTTLRGYRESQFFASQIAYINWEYRFLTGRASSFFGFIDGGYFSRPADQIRGITRQEKNLYGFGIGARVETGLGIMNINYALGEGDSFSNGKIHVGIINEF